MKVHEFMQKMNQLLKTTPEIGECDIVVEELNVGFKEHIEDVIIDGDDINDFVSIQFRNE